MRADPVLHQLKDAVFDHPCLARTGACDDKIRTVYRGNGLELGRVQSASEISHVSIVEQEPADCLKQRLWLQDEEQTEGPP